MSADQQRYEADDSPASISLGLILFSAASHRSLHIIFSIDVCEMCKRAGRGWWDPRLSVATQGLLRPSSPSTPFSPPDTWLCCPRSVIAQCHKVLRSKGRDGIWERTPSERCGRVSLSILHSPLMTTDTTSPSSEAFYPNSEHQPFSLLKWLKRPAPLMPQM